MKQCGRNLSKNMAPQLLRTSRAFNASVLKLKNSSNVTRGIYIDINEFWSTKEYDVVLNSEELTDTEEYLMLWMKCHINQCRYNWIPLI